MLGTAETIYYNSDLKTTTQLLQELSPLSRKGSVKLSLLLWTWGPSCSNVNEKNQSKTDWVLQMQFSK